MLRNRRPGNGDQSVGSACDVVCSTVHHQDFIKRGLEARRRRGREGERDVVRGGGVEAVGYRFEIEINLRASVTAARSSSITSQV